MYLHYRLYAYINLEKVFSSPFAFSIPHLCCMQMDIPSLFFFAFNFISSKVREKKREENTIQNQKWMINNANPKLVL